MSALVATHPSPDTSAPLPGQISDAYTILKLKPGASRREIKRAYHRLALESHPDRHEDATDGSVFQKVKAAYDLLCVHTEFDADLEAVDADLEQMQRELDALERKRRKREEDTMQKKAIMENILQFNREQRNEHAQQARQRLKEAEARLRARVDARARPVYDREICKPLPKGIMLEFRGGGTLLLKEQAGVDRFGRRVLGWVSDDRPRSHIEKRHLQNGETFWLLTLGHQHQFALHTPIPYNTAPALNGGEMLKWAEWYELGLDYYGRFFRGKPARLVSRAVYEDELGEIELRAHRDGVKDKERAQLTEFMEQLEADEKQEKEERQARENERQRLQKQREEAKRQKDAAHERARRLAEEEAKEQEVRRLEYLDAAWQAFLSELAAELAQQKDATKVTRLDRWEERTADVQQKQAERRAAKQKQAEKEEARSRTLAEARARKAAKQPSTQPIMHPAGPNRKRHANNGHANTDASSVPPTTLESLASLGVAELKGVIRAAGLAWDDCFEKTELRARALEALRVLQSEDTSDGAAYDGATASSHEAAHTELPAAGATCVNMAGATGEAARARKRKIRRVVESEDESDAEEAGSEGASLTAVVFRARGQSEAMDVVIKAEEESNENEDAADSAQAEDVSAKPSGEVVAAPSQETPGATSATNAHAVVKVDEPPHEDVTPVDTLSKLEMGTRLEVYWEEDDQWYAGGVASRWSEARGHLIRYDDGQRQWERLDKMMWRCPAERAADTGGAAKLEEASTIAIVSQPSLVTVTRSMRHDVKLAVEDYVGGEIRCPSCGAGVKMGGACNVITCRSSQHTNGFFYFCAHCKAECPDGEAFCRECPHRNDRATRMRIKAARDTLLAQNSAENPFVVDDD